WGDVRLFILGTEGYMELRKNTDIAGRTGGSHLFMVDGEGMHYVECADVELPFGRQFLADVRDRTETAMPQAHCFLASELALQAELKAYELTDLS
ncbi:MAG: gfo/Idh/MocA family oxidoreductase, partial [Anaerolineae bacterium]|nr:gfo/Idh/MocA family oxidoreductase [Anaerolineae bacterium]